MLSDRGRVNKPTHQIKAMTTSLAEELEATLLGLDQAGNSSAKMRMSLTLPVTSQLDADDDDDFIPCCCGNRTLRAGAGISQFLIDVAVLGTPEFIDPKNKYRDVLCDIAYGSIYEPDAENSSSRDHLDAAEDGGSRSAGEDSMSGSSDIIDVDVSSATVAPSLPVTGSAEFTEINDVTDVGMTVLRRLDDVNEDDVKGVSRVIECLPDVIAGTVTNSAPGCQGNKKPTGSSGSRFERTSSRDSSRKLFCLLPVAACWSCAINSLA